MWSDAQILLLIAALLYLSECLVWLPAQAVLLRDTGRGTWRRARHAMETAGLGRGLTLLPFRPWAMRSVLLAPSPFSACPDGATGFVAAQNGPIGRPAQPDTFTPIPTSQKISVLLREIRMGSTMLAHAADEATAKAGAALLHDLSMTSNREAREAMLKARIQQAADPLRVMQRFDAVRARARPVETLCLLLFLWLFVVAPAMAWHFGATRTLLPLFLATPVLHVPLAILFFRAHRNLCPDRRGDAWVELIKCLLSPPMAARAAETLWLHAFAGFHPLALLLARGDKRDREEDIRLEWNDLAYPAFPEDIPAPARECEAWHRRAYREALSLSLAGIPIDPLALSAKRPESIDPHLPWCRRCRDSVVGDTPICPMCGNRAAELFQQAAVEVPGSRRDRE